MRVCLTVALVLTLAPALHSQDPAVAKYIKTNAPHIRLTHVRIIDGTGAAPLEDQDLLIENGKIAAITASSAATHPTGETVLDLHGATVLPGLVGMHDHLYNIARPNLSPDGAALASDPPLIVPQMSFSAPRMYLAAGVTTIRTTGSVEPYADLNLKREIEAGHLPGPHMDVTGPYLEGPGNLFLQMHNLTGPDDARAFVDYWIAQGVTSFKAYMNITRDELKAAIDEAHKHGIKVTGHLCSVTYPEAAELGIDNLEHGFWVNTQLDPGKQPDQCPSSDGQPTLLRMTPDSPEAAALIRTLVDHHVAITSTLPVFETAVSGRPPLRPQMLAAMSPQARQDYLLTRSRRLEHPLPDGQKLLANDMALERRFVAAGGLLIAGPDPTGNGIILPGFGDQRELELLVEAGFTPVEAIRIATLNGAIYLNRQATIGSIAAGKNADLLVVKGNPAEKISDIENVELVFKDGVAYDSAKLFDSVHGDYGRY